MVNKTYTILCFILFLGSAFVTGCAGPLDKATRQALDSAYSDNTYLAKVYLGSRYNLDYTNNLVDGRSPTGVFIDRSLKPWYETDATGFFDAGSAGHEYTLEQLHAIDRDLDFDTFGQGILPGQVVVIKKITDKRDQVIFEVDTVSRYTVTKTYGFDTSSKAKPRSSRIHCMLGKKGMVPLDQAALQQLLDQVLAPVPAFATDVQKDEFILANYPSAPLDDLVKLTGFTREHILKISYTHLLSQSQLAPNLQEKLVGVLASNQDIWDQQLGIYLQNVRISEHALELDCAIQEIADSARYPSPELRAGFLFAHGVVVLAEAFGNALAATPAENFGSSLQKLVVKFSYPYFDRQGRRFPENMTAAITAEDLRQFADAKLSRQELADRSEILMGTDRVKFSLRALEAVESIKPAEPTTWKVVHVEIADWGYEENKDEGIAILSGEVKNTGTWIAEDVEITARAYDKYGFDIRSESTTLYGTLKPGATKTFTIKMSTTDVKRFRLFPKWQEVK